MTASLAALSVAVLISGDRFSMNISNCSAQPSDPFGDWGKKLCVDTEEAECWIPRRR